jgi:methylphosphotriester-DNA--protein-cysteine methyltransferase
LLAGNARMKIYGRLDCPSALRAIKRGPTYARHRVFFADEASAVAAGFRPCAVCLRAAYNSWKAKAKSPAATAKSVDFRKLIRARAGTANKPPTKRTKKAKEIPEQKP